MTRAKLVGRIRTGAAAGWVVTMVAYIATGDRLTVWMWALLTLCAVVWAYCAGWLHLYESAQVLALKESITRKEAELTTLPAYRSFSENRGLRLERPHNGHRFGDVD